MKISTSPPLQNTTTADDARTKTPSQSVPQTTTHETLIQFNYLAKQKLLKLSGKMMIHRVQLRGSFIQVITNTNFKFAFQPFFNEYKLEGATVRDVIKSLI